jgi:hypothetical protein
MRPLTAFGVIAHRSHMKCNKCGTDEIVIEMIDSMCENSNNYLLTKEYLSDILYIADDKERLRRYDKLATNLLKGKG